MSGLIERVGYVGLNVSNLDAWEAFATNVLALQSSGRDKNGVLHLRMDEHEYRFALHEGPEDDIAYIGLEVASSEDLSLLAQRLQKMGVEGRVADRQFATARRVKELIQFEHNGLSYEAYVGPTLLPQNPFHAPKSLDGFVTGDMGLGHLVIYCNDLADTLKFFCEGMGFRLSDVIDRISNGEVNSAHFLHCNARHHSVAVAKATGMEKKFHHVMIEVASVDDVGRAMDAAVANKVPIMQTLGRHTNDRMLSFYMRTPSGFWIEYGYGGRQIDPANWSVGRYDAGSSWGHRRPE